MRSNFRLSMMAFLAAFPFAFLLSLGFYSDGLFHSISLFCMSIFLWASLASIFTFYLLHYYNRINSPHIKTAWHGSVIGFISYICVTFFATIFRAYFFLSEWSGLPVLALYFCWYPLLAGWLIGKLSTKLATLNEVA